MDADSTDINMHTGSAFYNINVTITQSHIFISIAHITYAVPLLDVLLFCCYFNLVLSHTPNGGERWMRVVEHKFRPIIGAVFASLEAGIKFYEVYARVKELVNGYENIGATLIDFKNFQRDIKCYIGLRDADLFIDRLEKLKATQPQFYFAYDVDPQNRLTKFFWADATCIRNYSFFGDAVSFDPTYGTNKYDMVLTPFTGVNHHRKSVLFAGCLLLHEDDISFQWTFQHFLTAMEQKEPQFMITDQCPGIKKVIV
ncbi:protein FAR1-RELATED SEQUENCE 5-like [Silene latifolia]|uniref:protein FAR1-RELATED SEQUENCE 5-like n=1 Tax=Silene latifolia TaxID=37657 RepID=UPI003D76E5F9